MVKIKEVKIQSGQYLRWENKISSTIYFDNDSHTKLLKFMEDQINKRTIMSFTTGICNVGINEMRIEMPHEDTFDHKDFQELYNNQDNPNYQLMFTNHKDPVISFLAELLVKFN